ncbi:MAG: class I SAM-dependent methyltransferase [Phycisphaerae bacterium]|jgi:SAM-dependent methyltransferase
MDAATWFCYRLARYLHRRRRPGAAGCNPASFRQQDYDAWRSQTLAEHYDRYFGGFDLTGRDVLDFGCGDGSLARHVARRGPRRVIGIDLKPELIDRARAAPTDLPTKPEFVLGSNDRTIPLPAASIDVILCFDVLEHVMAYEAIVREWRRILRPGGRVLILWVPWFHPYGPHINSLAPIPWAHLLFSERTLLRTCALIYDAPDFVPRHWDLDEHGRKKPNKWRDLDELPEVNRLTIGRFETLCRRVGLHIRRAELKGFGGPLARLARVLPRLPVLRELCTSHTVYELERPMGGRPSPVSSGCD